MLTDAKRSWWQTFDYDRWGNRGLNTTGTNTSTNMAQGGSAIAVTEFSQTTNRISKTGYFYDDAGNLRVVPGRPNDIYDGENRLISSTVNSQVLTYDYDADGKRVKKAVGSAVTKFVYNSRGQLIAEYGGSGPMPGDSLQYATADHLGSPRVWTNAQGQVVANGRHDYAPFGEELGSAHGAVRSTIAGFSNTSQADGQRKQFVSKERDAETGLDYFLARYMSSIQGRLTGVDPLNPVLEYRNGIGDDEEREHNEMEFRIYLGQPQNWNRYAYVINTPLAMVDADGREGGYAYMPDGRMIAPGEPDYPKSRHPIRDTLIVGGAVAAALLGPEAAGPIASAVLGWLGRNPGTVQRIGEELVQASQGNPTAAPRLGPGQVESIGKAIGQSVMKMGSGQMVSIATQVTAKRLGQTGAVNAIQAAIKTVGKNCEVVNLANGDTVIASVMTGSNKHVLVVNANGAVASARATISAGVRNGKPYFEATDIVFDK